MSSFYVVVLHDMVPGVAANVVYLGWRCRGVLGSFFGSSRVDVAFVSRISLVQVVRIHGGRGRP